MRKKMAFRPTELGGLESRVALSAVGSVAAVTADVAGHHDHAPKGDHHHKDDGGHDHHKGHAAK